MGTVEIVLHGVLAEGAIWCRGRGLMVDPGVRGLTRLPPLLVRAGTARVVEWYLARRFPQTSLYWSLPLLRVLALDAPAQQAWPPPASVGLTQRLCELPLPVCGEPNRRCVLFD